MITKQDLRLLVHFYNQGSVEGWGGWEEKRHELEKEHLGLIAAVNGVKLAETRLHQEIQDLIAIIEGEGDET